MRTLPLASCFVMAAMFAGCQPMETGAGPKLAGAGMDMFTPTKMRIHPLSRIVYAAASTEPATQPASGGSAAPTLEARIELSDQFGDPTKGAGALMLQLIDESASFLGRKQVGTWSFSIDSPEANRDHWDRTTRTYLFRIPLPADFPAPGSGHERFELRATFTLPNNRSLSDTLELPNR